MDFFIRLINIWLIYLIVLMFVLLKYNPAVKWLSSLELKRMHFLYVLLWKSMGSVLFGVLQVCRVNVDFWVNCPFKEWLFRVMTLWPGLDFCISDGLSLSPSPPLSFWSCASYTSFSLFAMWRAKRHYFRVSFSSEPCIRFIYTVYRIKSRTCPLIIPQRHNSFFALRHKKKVFLTPS